MAANQKKMEANKIKPKNAVKANVAANASTDDIREDLEDIKSGLFSMQIRNKQRDKASGLKLK